MDMWDPFIASCKKNTGAEIVFDKFHIAKKVNDGPDQLRKHEFARKNPFERRDMKKKRFLILRRKSNVPDHRREELQHLLKANKTLYKAYVLKEQLLDILDEDNEPVALARLTIWIRNTVRSGIRELLDVLKTLQHYLYGVKNYFKYKLTNAASQGFNNKINLVKRRAYGYHDLKYFKLKIIQACGYKHTS